MAKKMVVPALLLFFMIGCDDGKNPLAGTEWLLTNGEDGNVEYLRFTDDRIQDYYHDFEISCFEYDEYNYAIENDGAFTISFGDEKAVYDFEIEDSVLTIVNPFENDTLSFVSTHFDEDTLSLCSTQKPLKRRFLR